MQPNQYQPGQVVQPQAPVQPQANYDFTQVQQPQAPQPAPLQPQQPAFDANAFKQEVVTAVKDAIQPAQPQQPAQQIQPNQPEYFNKQYDDWGVLEADTKKLVADVIDQKFTQMNQQQTEEQKAITEQEKANQQIIDGTLNDLRGAGYLPAVANPFDANDQGKQAENELIGYAVSLGTTNLVEAAKELKFKHDSGLKYDYKSKQWQSTGQPQQTGQSMFGELPQTPDAQVPNFAPQQPLQAQGQPQPMYAQPYGPQNPYVPQQYPAGFNAPVASGGGYGAVGMSGQAPNVSTLRHSSYDNLVEMFNRTQ
jgi:hypothetical protein